MIVEKLRQLGLDEKEISVYLTLVSIGPSPVKTISSKSGVNRGTAYDILDALIQQGLVAQFNKHGRGGKKQHFAAEPPEKILGAIEKKQADLASLKESFRASIPELMALYHKSGSKPVFKYYEKASGLRIILQDVIGTMSDVDVKQYYVYSASDIRDYLYQVYKDFNKDRIKAKISVKVIALGKGGEVVGLDERKWMSVEDASPSYQIVYGGKVAMISLAAGKTPVGVIIEDRALYETQKMIFEFCWGKL